MSEDEPTVKGGAPNSWLVVSMQEGMKSEIASLLGGHLEGGIAIDENGHLIATPEIAQSDEARQEYANELRRLAKGLEEGTGPEREDDASA